MYTDFDPFEKLLELEANLQYQAAIIARQNMELESLHKQRLRQLEHNKEVGAALQRMYDLILQQEQEIKELQNEKNLGRPFR